MADLAAAARDAAGYADRWLAFRREWLRVPGVQAAVWADGQPACRSRTALRTWPPRSRSRRRTCSASPRIRSPSPRRPSSSSPRPDGWDSTIASTGTCPGRPRSGSATGRSRTCSATAEACCATAATPITGSSCTRSRTATACGRWRPTARSAASTSASSTPTSGSACSARSSPPSRGGRTPEGRLSVAVCTNAVDGPARPLADGLVALAVLAAAEPDGAPVDATVDRYCGRYATLFGVEDVVRLGRRLLVLDPAADDPSAGYVALEPDGPHTFRVVRTPGYGAYGERVRFTLDDDGRVVSARMFGGVTCWPVEHLTAFVAGRDEVRLGDLAPGDPSSSGATA